MLHRIDTAHTCNRWNRDYAPVLTISGGDTLSLSLKDSSDGHVRPGMTIAEFAAIDKSLIHALTGFPAADGGRSERLNGDEV
jgi:acetamidase/formamidase